MELHTGPVDQNGVSPGQAQRIEPTAGFLGVPFQSNFGERRAVVNSKTGLMVSSVTSEPVIGSVEALSGLEIQRIGSSDEFVG